MEIWRKIDGLHTLTEYQVSNYGRVKSLNYKNLGYEHVLRPQNSGRGLFVNIGKDGTYYIDRLVAGAFIANPNNLPQVSHKDGDTTNNNVNNLKWVTIADTRYFKKCWKTKATL